MASTARTHDQATAVGSPHLPPQDAAHRGARYDATTPSVVISSLALTHPDVTAEALHWSTGIRGASQPARQVDGADVSAYVEQAVIVGARAIAAAGGTQDTYHLEQLVADVGQRTSESATRAVAATNTVVQEAATRMKAASAEATQALTSAQEVARARFHESVTTANTQLRQQLAHLLGGDDPELVTRLRPVLESFGADLTRRADAHRGFVRQGQSRTEPG